MFKQDDSKKNGQVKEIFTLQLKEMQTGIVLKKNIHQPKSNV